MKNENGITLIALIMIMVVLIILAGISVLIMLDGEKKAKPVQPEHYVENTKDTETPKNIYIDEMDIFEGSDNTVENSGNGEILLTENSAVVDVPEENLNTTSVETENTVDTNSVAGQQ